MGRCFVCTPRACTEPLILVVTAQLPVSAVTPTQRRLHPAYLSRGPNSRDAQRPAARPLPPPALGGTAMNVSLLFPRLKSNSHLGRVWETAAL